MLIPLLASCVALRKVQEVYDPRFPHLYNESHPPPFGQLLAGLLMLGKELDMVNT